MYIYIYIYTYMYIYIYIYVWNPQQSSQVDADVDVPDCVMMVLAAKTRRQNTMRQRRIRKKRARATPPTCRCCSIPHGQYFKFPIYQLPWNTLCTSIQSENLQISKSLKLPWFSNPKLPNPQTLKNHTFKIRKISPNHNMPCGIWESHLGPPRPHTNPTTQTTKP
jgi:hypothetical protein